MFDHYSKETIMRNEQFFNHGASVYTDNLNVLNIQRTCVHDGPGIRTVIFFAGCKLRCLWCQNPEGLSFHNHSSQYTHYTVHDIMEIVLKDKAYYFSTRGGVTLSGGEPLWQNTDSLAHLLQLLKQEQIHVAVETSCNVPWTKLETLLPYIDLFIIDLKLVGDDTLHMKYTGQNSQLIQSNIKKLVDLNATIKFRMVAVPGYNDTDANINATSDLLKSLNYHSIELLKYHNMYEAKAKHLGVSQASLNITNDQSIASVQRVVEKFQSLNIDAMCVEFSNTKERASFTKRVYDIQNDIRESDIYLCLESATLKTEFYKKNGFNKPTHIHRSERLAYLFNHKKIVVYPNELLVGNFTSKRVGSNVWEEYFGIALVSIIHQIHRQKPVSFKCSKADQLNFYTNIFPFWAKHSLVSKVNRSLNDWLLALARLSEMKVGFNNNMAAIAHFIVNHERMLKLGTTGIIEEIIAKQKENPNHNQDFYNGALIALRALEQFASRYADHLMGMSKKETDSKRRLELESMAAICNHVPKNPARSFHEALQSMLFLQIALCTESFENAVSFGRIDQILYPYYQKDKDASILTYEQAKELLACFILKIDEVVLTNDGDNYFGIGKLFESLSTVQTVTFGGVKPDGTDGTNDITYMMLDICELQPRGVNVAARIHKNSPSDYLKRIAEVYINGSPMPALFNDDVYVESLIKKYPTSVENARNYSIVGCVEPVASNDHFANTDCANMNVTLPLLQALKGEDNDLWTYGLPGQVDRIVTKFVNHTFKGYEKWTKPITTIKNIVPKFIKNQIRSYSYNIPSSMDELLDRYQLRMNQLAKGVLSDHQKIEKELRNHFTTPLTSSLYEGCIDSGKDVYEGGTTFNSSGIQAVGITDVADSLFAINDVVFTNNQYTLEEVIHAIDDNFEGDDNQQIRTALLNVPKFGNDSSPETQYWVNKVLDIYVNALNSVENCPRDGIYTAGYYALNVNIIYGFHTPALPSGRLSGVPLAHSIAPHYGMQMVDLVSALNSVSGVDFETYAPNGTTITFTVDSALFQGDDGAPNLGGLIHSFFKKGGMQFQPNVINRDILIDAYNHPEKHKYLLVRVAGYCSYFNELSDELKLAIINRTCYS